MPGDVGDTAAGAQRMFLGHILDLQTQFGPVTKLRLEHRRLVGRTQNDVLDTGRRDSREQMGEKRQPGGGQHRLGHRQRQRPQSSAFAADQNDCVDPTVCHRHRPSDLRRAPRTMSPPRTANPARMAQHKAKAIPAHSGHGFDIPFLAKNPR